MLCTPRHVFESPYGELSRNPLPDGSADYPLPEMTVLGQKFATRAAIGVGLDRSCDQGFLVVMGSAGFHPPRSAQRLASHRPQYLALRLPAFSVPRLSALSGIRATRRRLVGGAQARASVAAGPLP